MKLVHISAEQLLKDSFTLALQIMNSGYRPDLLVGIWRGGTPIAIAVHEALEFSGLPSAHCVLQVNSYTGIGSRQSVQVHDIDALATKAGACKRLLLVDDVFDSGQSMFSIISNLQDACGDNMPEVKIAVPYYKPANNTTTLTPDFFQHESSAWLVFPHELVNLENAELRQKPGLGAIVEQLLEHRSKNTGHSK